MQEQLSINDIYLCLSLEVFRLEVDFEQEQEEQPPTKILTITDPILTKL